MSSSNDWNGYAYSDLREKLISAELPALREAGLLDPDTIRMLESYRQHYEPNTEPHYEKDETAYWYYNTERYTEIVRRNLGENLSKAVKNEEWGLVKHATGLNKNQSEDSDVVDYERFRELIQETGLVLNISGPTKSGKTATACRFLEFVYTIHNPNIRVATHIKSLAENYDWIDFIRTDEELKEWCKEHQGVEKYFIGDEAHEWGTGYSHQAQGVQKKMSSFVRLAGKEPYNVKMILICHRADGMHPALQNDELCYYARKEGETLEEARQNVVFYDSLAGGDLTDEKFDLDVRDTNLNYSIHDTTQFEIIVDGEDSSDEDTPDVGQAEYESCRVCERNVGIDNTGFCPDHSMDDLHEPDNDAEDILGLAESADSLHW
ncbi:hypothetical protein GOC74_05130 [Halomicrobium mukohataei]|uniref:Uncharacterized protein n=1 Tax=Halomicrobium mukohataei TaxID=57705 RepID=A0A847U114_9EURY|nr:hypothetical protein [Halomicrobium mukohataei]NLV09313.1 hypothetical protein [Halomicrobium mukohataei]